MPENQVRIQGTVFTAEQLRCALRAPSERERAAAVKVQLAATQGGSTAREGASAPPGPVRRPRGLWQRNPLARHPSP